MKVCCQHNDRVGQDVCRICTGKEGLSGEFGGKRREQTQSMLMAASCMGECGIKFSYSHSLDFPARDVNPPLIAFKISRCKFLHEPVDLLGLSGEPKALQESPQRRNKVFALEVHLIHVGVHHLFIEMIIISEEFSHLSLGEQK